MTSTKKYQVFLSSTFIDLKEERAAAITSILDLGHIPSGMELFVAADEEQFEYIKKVIDQCDYYVLVLKARYGTIANDGLSFTEKEYEYAVSRGKVVLAFIYSKPEQLTISADVNPAAWKQFKSFREKVMTGRVVKTWETLDQLQASLIVSLTKAFSERPQLGWTRGSNEEVEDVLRQLNEVRVRNELLVTLIKSYQIVPRKDILADEDATVDIYLADSDEDHWDRIMPLTPEYLAKIFAIKFVAETDISKISETLRAFLLREGRIIERDYLVNIGHIKSRFAALVT